MRKRNKEVDCKVQTLALELITPFNECTGRLSRVSTRHKHKRRGMQKMVRETSRECHNHKPQPFPDTGRGNRQIKTSTNRTNVRKAPGLALSSPSEVIALLKGLKNTRTKLYKVRHKTNQRKILVPIYLLAEVFSD